MFSQLLVSPTSNVPYGPVSVVIGGITFSYAAGNILSANIAGANTNYWGGVLISSIVGSASTTGVVSTASASYEPGAVTPSTTSPAPAPNQIGIFGYGFAATGAISIVSTATITPIISPVASPSGAFFSTQTLGDTPWSSAATPTTQAFYPLTVTQGAPGPTNILSPSFGIIPWIAGLSSVVDYTTSNALF
jgi:hypothetical protein